MVHAPIWKTGRGQIADQHPGLRIIIDHVGIMARCEQMGALNTARWPI